MILGCIMQRSDRFKNFLPIRRFQALLWLLNWSIAIVKVECCSLMSIVAMKLYRLFLWTLLSPNSNSWHFYCAIVTMQISTSLVPPSSISTAFLSLKTSVPLHATSTSFSSSLIIALSYLSSVSTNHSLISSHIPRRLNPF